MKKILFILFLLPISLLAQDIGADYYVAHPDSTYSGMGTPSDSNDGSYATPWATWYKAISSAQSGDKICIRGGTYHPKWTDYNDATLVNDSVKLFGYPGEQPIIDGDSLVNYIQPNASNDVYNFGLRIITHAHDSIINIDFRNFKQYFQTDSETGDTINWLPVGGVINAQNCVHMYYEDVNIHDCMIKGFVQYSGYWNDFDSIWAVSLGYSEADASPPFDSAFGDTTKWVDCDVYNMVDLWSWEVGSMDYEGGNHADCWKGGNYQYSEYTWENCRGWNYTDDGIDFNLPGKKIFNNCWMSSNHYNDTLVEFEGNGFKTTAYARNDYYFPERLEDTIISKYTNCVAVFCPNGYLNDFFADVVEGEDKASGNAYFYNCIGYGNDINLDLPVPQGDTVLTSTIKNSLMFGSTDTNPCGDPRELNVINTVNLNNALGTGDHRNNIYYTGYTTGGCGRWGYDTQHFTVTSDDFKYGLDSATLMANFTAPRNADGSYSVHPFTLDPTSDLIDAGVDVGVIYKGSSPDVGAAEFIPLIADHTVVDQYENIPQQWIDSVKTMLVWVPGQSHGYGYFRAAELMELYDTTFQSELWYNTSTPSYTNQYLRIGRPGQGDEGFFTSDTWADYFLGQVETQNITGNEFDAVIFGWSYQGTWFNNPAGDRDAVYDVRWGGQLAGGPDGDARWGLDSGDSVLTDNRVNASTYLTRFEDFLDTFDIHSYGTEMFYSTLCVDGDGGTELGYQRELKTQYIRDFVEANPEYYLFDYADILVYDEGDTLYEQDWNDGGDLRPHQQIHPDNLLDYDASFNIIAAGTDAVEDHIGEVGALRLGKALWWLLARKAGWDGVSGDVVIAASTPTTPDPPEPTTPGRGRAASSSGGNADVINGRPYIIAQ